MFDAMLNVILCRKSRVDRLGKKFIETLESELVEDFLNILLKLMGLMFCIDKSFRRNIENFDARYVFKDKSGEIAVSALFKNSKMKVKKKEVDKTNVTIIFKDQRALMNFLLSPKPDILNAVLNQDVSYKGNLNYISKFAFMATHLVSMVKSK